MHFKSDLRVGLLQRIRRLLHLDTVPLDSLCDGLRLFSPFYQRLLTDALFLKAISDWPSNRHIRFPAALRLFRRCSHVYITPLFLPLAAVCCQGEFCLDSCMYFCQPNRPRTSVRRSIHPLPSLS